MILERSLVEISKEEIIQNVKNKEIVTFFKNHNEGIEKCFHGFFNESELIACTTWSDSLGSVKKHDIGWVLLISPHSKEPFFSFEIRRTKNFCDKMIAWIDCMIDIALRWPVLPGTDIKLELVRANKMHMRRFRPPRNMGSFPFRKPYHFWIVEMDLSENNSKFLIKAFKDFYSYRRKDDEKRLEAGEEPREFRRVKRYKAKHGIKDDYYNDGTHLE